jgi:prepilin-type N-terminal cleavage/methylation domain-containing protein
MSRRGFMLIELLVVVTIIVVLLAMLVPAMGRSLEAASRTNCASQLRQLSVSCLSYAADNDRLLPSGERDDLTWQHTPWVSDVTHSALMSYTEQVQVLHCPNWADFGYHNSIGWVIGYNYLAARDKINAVHNWAPPSPMRATEPGNRPVASDYNNWSPPDGWTFVPHTANGAYSGVGAVTPQVAGSEGGNLAVLDGAVYWKALAKMTLYETWNGPDGTYPGYW